MKKFKTVWPIFTYFFIPSLAFAQDSLKQHVLTLSEAFRLAIDNSLQLKVTAKNVNLAHQQTEVRKLGRLPSLTTGLNYGYISNADIWTPGFEQHILGLSPHHLVSFNVVAGQV